MDKDKKLLFEWIIRFYKNKDNKFLDKDKIIIYELLLEGFNDKKLINDAYTEFRVRKKIKTDKIFEIEMKLIKYNEMLNAFQEIQLSQLTNRDKRKKYDELRNAYDLGNRPLHLILSNLKSQIKIQNTKLERI
tara:strand:+ start:106 stop:504 length:399 start_codon:yes stop_codon:yes gene_type:complete